MKTLGSRIAHYRKLAQMSQAKLAKKCGWASQSRIGNYEKDAREPSLDDIASIAEALGISADLLLSDGGFGNVSPVDASHRKSRGYPLISWVAAGCWQESCDDFLPGVAEEWIASDAGAGDHGYWLEVKGNSMTPSFSPGMRILVQPEGFDLVSGKFYIAKLLDSGETTFKQYVRDAGREFLQPLNPAFPVLAIDDNVRIIGRVIDARQAPSMF